MVDVVAQGVLQIDAELDMGSLNSAFSGIAGQSAMVGRSFDTITTGFSGVTSAVGTFGGAVAKPFQNLVSGFNDSRAAASSFTGFMGSLGGATRDVWDGISERIEATKTKTQSFSSVVAGVAGGIAASFATKAIDLFANSVSNAVQRVDTMNNFPKIMQNLGYSSADATKSIETMSDKLRGLPTSLDQMTSAVTQLAPLTGGLAQATDISLALNNALLAGGKSTAVQSNAMEQYVQMLSVGKVDMAAWKSMVTAMPGQMDQLSESLIGTGASTTDLYNAMQDGTISFDQFNSAMLDLNKNGLEGFASFEQQAKSATDGIGTGVANLETAVTRNLANVIDKFQPVITGVLSGITDFVNGLGQAATWMADNMNIVIPVLAALGTVILAALIPPIIVATAAVWGFTTALLANPITWVVAAIALLVAGIVALAMNWDSVVAWVTDIWSGFISWATEATAGFAAWWDSLWAGFGAWVTEVWTGFTTWISEIFNAFVLGIQVGLGLFAAGWDAIWSAVGSFIATIWAGIQSMLAGVISWIQGTFQGAFSALVGFFSGIWSNISSGVTNAWEGVMSFLGSIPGRIQGFFAGVGNWLYSAGESLIQGFINGIKGMIKGVGNAVGGVLDFARGFFPNSPAKRGPFSGAGWTGLSKGGEALMEEFLSGMDVATISEDMALALAPLRNGLTIDVGAPLAGGRPAPAPVQQSARNGAVIEAGAIVVTGPDPYKIAMETADRIAREVLA